MTKRTVLDRFVEKFRVDDDSPCWLWTAARGGKGSKDQQYGKFYVNGKLESAHRVAYWLFVGPIPDGLHIDHLCRNRQCVNPAHLEPVTQIVNTLRGVGFTATNARVTHCPQGHEYDVANTYRPPKGGRGCRKCRTQQVYACLGRSASWDGT